MQLFWFPFAGAHGSSYRDIQRRLSPAIENIQLELPGHGMRIKEPLLKDIHLMKDYLLSVIGGKVKGRYAFYGHSMGAVLAYLCTMSLARKRETLPAHLFLSGRAAPSVEGERRNRHLLPDGEFIEMLHTLGGSPREVLEHAELMELMLPILRADFEAVEKYRREDAPPLPVPITVMNGDNDVRPEHAEKWQEETGLPLEMHRFPGDHFFIFEHGAEIARLITKNLEKA